ncbi:MAG TPA: ABC transporter substrate-binding protein [Stellaceae bacterium]|nr:ABC transporter substrate-binding protein [Stellaceae bacterium]
MRWSRSVNPERPRRRVAALCGAILVAAALTGIPAASGAEPDPVVVSLPAESVQFLPFYVAQDEGFFAQQGLAVKLVYLAGVGTTNGVISGAVDFGFSNGASITRAAARGQRLIAIALMADRPTWSIILRADVAAASHFDPQAPLAERARLMAGRRIAVDSIQSVAHAYTRVMAKLGGLDPESVAVSPLAATEAIAAMQRKAIDGITIASPWQEQMAADGSGTIIADSLKGDPAWLTPFAGGLVITRVSFCAERRQSCLRMGQALVAAVTFVHDRKEDALAILLKHFPTFAPAVLQRAFETVQTATPATPAPTAAAVANSDHLNLEAGFITVDEQLKSYDGLVTDEYVR